MPANPALDPLGPPAATLEPPRSARMALNLARLLAAYAAAMAALSLPVGLFVGPLLLWSSLGHALLAGILFAAAGGLQRRRAWGRWLLAGIAASLMVAIPAALAIEGGADRAAWAWFGGVAVYAGVMLGATLAPSAGRWCRGG